MSPSTAAEHRRTRRAFVLVAITAAGLAAALSAAWFVLAGRLEAATDDLVRHAASQGIVVACDNRRTFGYPFRLGIRCDGTRFDAAEGVTASAGALRTAGQIYDPTRFVAELDGPLVVDTPEGPPLDLRWRLAQASAHVWTEGLDRLSIVVEAPEVSFAEPAAGRRPLMRSDHIEAHLRRRDDALDLALADSGIAMADPALSGIPAFDVSADATIEGAAGWLAGEAAGATLGEALAGRKGTIRALRIALARPAAAAAAPAAPATGGSASAELSGPFEVAADGRLSGTFQLALSDPAGIANLVGALDPALAGMAGSIAAAVGFAGRPVDGRTVIDIAVRNGDATLGFIPLGTIPPIR